MKDLKDRALELKDKLDKDSKEAGEVEILQAKLKENFENKLVESVDAWNAKGIEILQKCSKMLSSWKSPFAFVSLNVININRSNT